jgi:hypothetical protein
MVSSGWQLSRTEEGDASAVGPNFVFVDDGGEDLRRQLFDSRLGPFAAGRGTTLDPERVVSDFENDLQTIGRGVLDHDARQLVDRNAQVFDVFDIEAQPAGNP